MADTYSYPGPVSREEFTPCFLQEFAGVFANITLESGHQFIEMQFR